MPGKYLELNSVEINVFKIHITTCNNSMFID